MFQQEVVKKAGHREIQYFMGGDHALIQLAATWDPSRARWVLKDEWYAAAASSMYGVPNAEYAPPHLVVAAAHIYDLLLQDRKPSEIAGWQAQTQGSGEDFDPVCVAKGVGR
jgi:hypothetical protein